MILPGTTKTRWKILAWIVVIGTVVTAVSLNWPRGDAFAAALGPLIGEERTDRSAIARAILDNYIETRSIASKWSGVYWGFLFLAATCSTLAGVILKVESLLKNSEVKKDVAALLSVSAALLITISTSGDFQRKWQANRVAASELERAGYSLLADNAATPGKYFTAIGNIVHKRNLAIVGDVEQQKMNPEQVSPAAQAE